MINICNSSQSSSIIKGWNHTLSRNESSKEHESPIKLRINSSFNCAHVEKEDIKQSTEFMLKAYSQGLISKEKLHSYIALFVKCLIESSIDRKLSNYLEKFLSRKISI